MCPTQLSLTAASDANLYFNVTAVGMAWAHVHVISGSCQRWFTGAPRLDDGRGAT